MPANACECLRMPLRRGARGKSSAAGKKPKKNEKSAFCLYAHASMIHAHTHARACLPTCVCVCGVCVVCARACISGTFSALYYGNRKVAWCTNVLRTRTFTIRCSGRAPTLACKSPIFASGSSEMVTLDGSPGGGQRGPGCKEPRCRRLHRRLHRRRRRRLLFLRLVAFFIRRRLKTI
jgi:hypothetical protein